MMSVGLHRMVPLTPRGTSGSNRLLSIMLFNHGLIKFKASNPCCVSRSTPPKNITTPIVPKPCLNHTITSCVQRRFCSSSHKNDGDEPSSPETSRSEAVIQPSHMRKYVPFSDDETEIILDFDEEKYAMAYKTAGETSPADDGVPIDPSETGTYLYRKRKRSSERGFELNLSRGTHGVFDVVDLVQALKLENMMDVTVIKLEPELRYTDYIILATAKSSRHMTGSIEFLRKLHKLKKHPSDPHLPPTVDEHLKSSWQILDMGYIVLHLFLSDVREIYDLETLWTVGSKFDDKTIRPDYDTVVNMMEKHITFISNLEASDPKFNTRKDLQ